MSLILLWRKGYFSTAVTDIAFGSSVSLSGNYAIVGASDDNENESGAGAAYIFQRDDSNWFKLSKLLASDGDESARMGWSVDVDGNKVVVGAPMQDAGGGAVYLYSDFITAINESGVLNDNQTSTYVQIYPNPAGELIRLQSSVFALQPGVVEISDLNGRRLIVKQILAGTEIITLDVHGLRNGIYICKIWTNNHSSTKKLIIQK